MRVELERGGYGDFTWWDARVVRDGFTFTGHAAGHSNRAAARAVRQALDKHDAYMRFAPVERS